MGKAGNTVALFEPMPVHLLPLDHGLAVEEVSQFFSASRSSLVTTGRAASYQADGQVPDNPFGESRGATGLRTRQVALGEIQVGKPLSADFTLVVKHNAAFTALLGVLVERFEAYAVIRNPLAVLASWNSVELPVRHGRLPAGERLDTELKRRLDGEPDRLARQIMLLDWMLGIFASVMPPDRIIRYESLVESQGQSLAELTRLAVPTLETSSRNSSVLYDAAACAGYAQRLRDSAGKWRYYYSDRDIAFALEGLLGAQ